MKKKELKPISTKEARLLRIHKAAVERYGEKNIEIVYSFAKEVKKLLGDFLKGIILFGSLARNKQKPHDIDILLIVNDIDFMIDQEVATTYRILVEEAIARTSKKIHVTTFRFTSFWEYVRVADPVAVNILREGIPIYDTGFFEPLQMLLRQGRIRPTPEAIYSYKHRAERSLGSAKWHKNNIVLSLYWTVTDIAHAALMAQGITPHGPEQLAGLIEERFVKTKMIPKRYALIMQEFYDLMKEITTHGGIDISSRRIEELEKKARDFYKTMSKLIP
ncbi:nucleotidyltransferase domain-containing protein [Candidatus Woesearchaeota archaeon]|nr:nucleotidyltransferase domain-containing protein [Candidatus Woesearchaeota archaeon]